MELTQKYSAREGGGGSMELTQKYSAREGALVTWF